VKSSKAGSEVWPSRPVKSSSVEPHHSADRRDADVDEYQPVPSYEVSLSDAIQAALDSYDQSAGECHLSAVAYNTASSCANTKLSSDSYWQR